MNERIRELAKQAEKVIGYTDGGYTEIKSLDPERFAELIVKECISVPYSMWDQAELNADVAVKIEHRIKEHFGMEQ